MISKPNPTVPRDPRYRVASSEAPRLQLPEGAIAKLRDATSRVRSASEEFNRRQALGAER